MRKIIKKKKTMLDELYELYANPMRISGAEMAEESLNRFKASIIKK